MNLIVKVDQHEEAIWPRGMPSVFAQSLSEHIDIEYIIYHCGLMGLLVVCYLISANVFMFNKHYVAPPFAQESLSN